MILVEILPLDLALSKNLVNEFIDRTIKMLCFGEIETAVSVWILLLIRLGSLPKGYVPSII